VKTKKKRSDTFLTDLVPSKLIRWGQLPYFIEGNYKYWVKLLYNLYMLDDVE
jgi:hypothetical protein